MNSFIGRNHLVYVHENCVHLSRYKMNCFLVHEVVFLKGPNIKSIPTFLVLDTYFVS